MHPSLTSFTFGAEFEVLLPVSLPREHAAAAVSRASGLTVASHYGASGTWKVVSDGSLRGPRGYHGLEFVSPVLRGDEGLAQVVAITNALRSVGAKVNSTCGFHVHVGGHGSELTFFKNLVKLYGKFETALDSIMPSSRRGNIATYCKSVALGSRDIDGCNSKEEIARRLSLASRAAGAKYHKVNIIPAGKPTVEFRHHSGTVDSVKATNWIVTCLRLVAAAKEGKSGEGQTARAIAWDLARLRGKQLHVASLVSRENGATNEEIRFAYGYATISARKQLGDAGFTYRVTRDRGTGKDRFFAVLPTASSDETAPIPATLAGLADLIGSDSQERAFFARRSGQPVPA